MSTNNYFRCGNETFLFDVRDQDSAYNAWKNALSYSAAIPEHPSVCVWKPFKSEGPWSGCDIIGYPSVGTAPRGPASELLSTGWMERRAIVDAQWSAA